MATQTNSLYDRLGGLDAINAVTESWVARVGGDDRANGKFARTDIARLKKELVDQLCEATGGPCTYTGRSMRDTHDGMKVTAGEFEVAMQHLGAALDELNVPKTEQDELVDLLRPMRDDIVEVESPETGTRFLTATRPRPLWGDRLALLTLSRRPRTGRRPDPGTAPAARPPPGDDDKNLAGGPRRRQNNARQRPARRTRQSGSQAGENKTRTPRIRRSSRSRSAIPAALRDDR